MSWFKRLCLFVFGVSGILSLAALSLTWVGPWTAEARSMLELRYYLTVLEVLVCLSGAGLILCVLMALFAPRNPKETVVSKVPGGEIIVTRAAIVSQARHVIEADGSCIAASVRVRMRKRGNVRINARVTPRRPIDVIARGASLHDELEKGLALICGESVRSVDIVFNEPEQQGPTRTYVEHDDDEKTRDERADVRSAATSDKEISLPARTLTQAVEEKGEEEQTPVFLESPLEVSGADEPAPISETEPAPEAADDAAASVEEE